MKGTKEMPGILQSLATPAWAESAWNSMLPVNNYMAYQRNFPNTTFVDVTPLIKKIRMIKSPLKLNKYELPCA